AISLENESPVKYFEVLLAFDATDTERMKPASRVSATIFVERQQQVLSVPNQAVFQKDDQSWVWLADGSRFSRTPVELGRRSMSRTVILDGLESGARVALVDPEPGEEG
ncbi:MAG: hypothetical protein JSV80_06650, partial [Acidobacteriota bacterium]